MFISDAYASAPSPTTAATTAPATDTGAPIAEPSPFTSVMPLILIFVVFYFLLIRPQQKKIKEHEALVGSIKRGDKVVTGGGILGQVYKVEADSQYIVVEVAQGVNVRVLRGSIMSIVDKVPSDDEKKSKGDSNKPTANDNAEAK